MADLIVPNHDRGIAANDQAWHGKFTVLGRPLTREDVMTRSSIGDRIEVVPAPPIAWAEGVTNATDYHVAVNTHTGKVVAMERRTRPFTQFPDLLDLVDAAGLIDSMDCAFTIRAGRTACITCTNGETIVLPGGDEILPYVSFLDSHDGQVCKQALLSDVRTVCWNTISLALLTGQVGVKMRHSGDMDAKAQDARSALAVLAGQRQLAIHEARRLIDTPVTDDQFWAIIGQVFPKPADDAKAFVLDRWMVRNEQIRDLWENDARVGDYRNTGWGAVQAVSTWEQQVRPIKGGAKADGGMTGARQTATIGAMINGALDPMATKVRSLVLPFLTRDQANELAGVGA